MKAEITIEYGSPKQAEAIARALSPDNVKVPPGLTVVSKAEGKMLIATIECRSLKTLIATIDDLLSCVQAAEKALQAASDA